MPNIIKLNDTIQQNINTNASIKTAFFNMGFEIRLKSIKLRPGNPTPLQL